MRIWIVLGTLAAGVIVACRDTSAPPAFAGRYHLAAVNGAAVPTPFETGVDIQSGWLLLDAGGDWMLERTVTAYSLPGRLFLDTLSGRWSASGNDITLYFATTSVVQAVATYAPPAVVVTYVGKRYEFVPD